MEAAALAAMRRLRVRGVLRGRKRPKERHSVHINVTTGGRRLAVRLWRGEIGAQALHFGRRGKDAQLSQQPRDVVRPHRRRRRRTAEPTRRKLGPPQHGSQRLTCEPTALRNVPQALAQQREPGG